MPDSASVPVQPPDAVHEVAFVDDHVNADVAPLTIEVLLAIKDTVGNEGDCATVTITDFVVVPPAPVQAKV